jgi:glucosamine--fructose-6-phosphate aminotransferase (isomerizing)
MEREIFEQPEALERALNARPNGTAAILPELEGRLGETLVRANHVVGMACGSSRHALLVARHTFESLAGLRVDCDPAAELQARAPLIDRETLLVAVSQSGETADLLQAMRRLRAHGGGVIGVANVVASALGREADALLPTRAGVEVGVASTKAFLNQVMVLELLALDLAKRRGADAALIDRHLGALRAAPAALAPVLAQSDAIAEASRMLTDARAVLFLGRGTGEALAFEGALKLQEISYVPSIGLSAGEMKHGPIALVDERVTSVFLLNKGPWRAKMLSNLQEVKARKGRILGVVTEGDTEAAELCDAFVSIPDVPEPTANFAVACALQLLAYHAARQAGRNVDKPRNLAKSVTVE